MCVWEDSLWNKLSGIEAKWSFWSILRTSDILTCLRQNIHNKMVWDGDPFCNNYWNLVMVVLLVSVVVVVEENRGEEGEGVFNAQALGGNLCNGTTNFRGLMLCLCACCQPVCTWEPVNRALLRLLSAFWSYQLEWWSTVRSLISILQTKNSNFRKCS
jgi:hypothetical protein